MRAVTVSELDVPPNQAYSRSFAVESSRHVTDARTLFPHLPELLSPHPRDARFRCTDRSLCPLDDRHYRAECHYSLSEPPLRVQS